MNYFAYFSLYSSFSSCSKVGIYSHLYRSYVNNLLDEIMVFDFNIVGSLGVAQNCKIYCQQKSAETECKSNKITEKHVQLQVLQTPMPGPLNHILQFGQNTYQS